MTARDDIRLLDQSVVEGGPLDWIVAGKAVVALFSTLGKCEYTNYDQSHLGCSLHDTSANDSLRLAIGINKHTNKLLVTLIQRVRMAGGKRDRVFFLCVPTESLVLDVADPAVWLLSDGVVPSNIVTDADADASRAGPRHGSRLLRVSFRLGAQKSRVVMPKYPHTGRVPPKAIALLRKLKALSEAGRFDVFVAHDSWTQQALFACRDMVGKAQSPTIKYAGFYPPVVKQSSIDSDNTKLALGRLLKRKRLGQGGGMSCTSEDHDPSMHNVTLPPYEPRRPLSPRAARGTLAPGAPVAGPVAAPAVAPGARVVAHASDELEVAVSPTSPLALAPVSHAAPSVAAVVASDVDTSGFENSLLDYVTHSPLPIPQAPGCASGLASAMAPLTARQTSPVISPALSVVREPRALRENALRLSRERQLLQPGDVVSPEIVAFPPSAHDSAPSSASEVMPAHYVAVCVPRTPEVDSLVVAHVSARRSEPSLVVLVYIQATAFGASLQNACPVS
ncbi:hypothetical protein MBLNU459_g7315t2 [Dothideomycetes sp. NU459]